MKNLKNSCRRDAEDRIYEIISLENVKTTTTVAEPLIMTPMESALLNGTKFTAHKHRKSCPSTSLACSFKYGGRGC